MDRYTSKEKKEVKIEDLGDKLVLETDSFNPQHIFECGQCFNFQKEEDNSYTAIFMGKIINVGEENGKIILKNISLDDFYNYFYDYFDLATDYGSIKKALSFNENLKKAGEYGYGIRILNQEVFETVISFIISANNQIPRIKKSIRIISENYGDYIGEYRGRKYYSFPSPKKLSKADPLDLRQYARVGFRDKRIVETSRLISEGYLNYQQDQKLSSKDLGNKLIELPGIGPKVAACIMLFAYHRREVFPVDVRIKRVMENLFIGEEVPKKQISTYAEEIFGDLAGYAQQYLFYYGREEKIGK